MAFKMNPALKAYGKSAGDNRAMKMAPTKMNPSAMKNEEEGKKKKKSTIEKIKDKVVNAAERADNFVETTARRVGDTKIPGTNTSLRDAASKADNFLEGNN